MFARASALLVFCDANLMPEARENSIELSHLATALHDCILTQFD